METGISGQIKRRLEAAQRQAPSGSNAESQPVYYQGYDSLSGLTIAKSPIVGTLKGEKIGNVSIAPGDPMQLQLTEGLPRFITPTIDRGKPRSGIKKRSVVSAEKTKNFIDIRIAIEVRLLDTASNQQDSFPFGDQTNGILPFLFNNNTEFLILDPIANEFRDVSLLDFTLQPFPLPIGIQNETLTIVENRQFANNELQIQLDIEYNATFSNLNPFVILNIVSYTVTYDQSNPDIQVDSNAFWYVSWQQDIENQATERFGTLSISTGQSLAEVRISNKIGYSETFSLEGDLSIGFDWDPI